MASISTSDFFKTPRNQSEVKSEILNEYFKAWAAILLRGQKHIPISNLLYIDLYAGKGLYDNGQPSAPIKILSSISADLLFNQKVKTFFNDSEEDVVAALEKNILGLPFYASLTHKPSILNKPADKNLLLEFLKNEKQNPSFTFIDPFGYKGLSAELCLNAVRNWGSDLFLLFNLNRIRSGIKNTNVEHLMRDLFAEKFDYIKKEFDNLNVMDREEFIVEKFTAHFRERNYRTIKFRVEFEDKNATSHYLLFVSKVDIAYVRMKEIMAKYSDRQTDGVPWFAVNNSRTQNLFSEYSIQNLKFELVQKKEFSGLTIEEIYQRHNIGTHYIKENYKMAYDELLKENSAKLMGVDKDGKVKKKLTYTTIIKFL